MPGAVNPAVGLGVSTRIILLRSCGYRWPSVQVHEARGRGQPPDMASSDLLRAVLHQHPSQIRSAEATMIGTRSPSSMVSPDEHGAKHEPYPHDPHGQPAPAAGHARAAGRSRILTTHTGSLPRTPDMLETLRAIAAGQAVDMAAYEAALANHVA